MKWAGLTLVVVGLILLCNTHGLLPWACWSLLGLYWPVLFIVAGVELLVRRRVSLRTIILVALMIVVLGGVLLRTPLGRYIPGQDLIKGPKWYWLEPPVKPRRFFPFPQVGAGEPSDLPRAMLVVQPIPAGVDRARYELRIGGGKLRIGGTPEFLIDGKVEYWFQKPEVACRVTRGEAVVTLEHVEKGTPGCTVDLGLSEKVPVAIGIDAGACDAELDLSKLKVTDLAVDIGASRLSINFGNTGVSTRARIKAGASRVDLVAPQAVGVRIKSESAFGDQDFSDQGLLRADEYWVSPGWDQASTKIDIEIQAGVSSVRLKRV